MGDIINLKKFKKSKQRAQDESTAQENRAKSGATKLEKQKSKAEALKLARTIDGARLSNSDDKDGRE